MTAGCRPAVAGLVSVPASRRPPLAKRTSSRLSISARLARETYGVSRVVAVGLDVDQDAAHRAARRGEVDDLAAGLVTRML